MLFPEEDSPLLKAWIMKRLEKDSDADADVLADYVLALLHSDGDAADVRKLCETEIPDFLKEDSAGFVDDVFRAITYRSYLPGAPPLPPKFSAPLSSAQIPFLPPGGYENNALLPAGNGFPALNASRKRSYHNLDAPGGGDAAPAYFSGVNRSYKQPRRSQGHAGGGGRVEDGWRGDAPGRPMQLMSGEGVALPSFDPQQAMEAMMQMQTMGLPNLMGFQGGLQQQRPGRRRQRCRNFDTKGFCARGPACHFEHVSEPASLPGLMPLPSEGWLPSNFSVPKRHSVQHSTNISSEYNPSESNLLSAGFLNFPPMPPNFGTNRIPNGHKKRHQGGAGRGKGRPRSAFSAEGAVHDRTKSTIVVEGIPEEHFSEEQVRGFFSQFGSITEVTMHPYKHLAVVKYTSWNEANAAYRSPKVVFDNRFVKVYWHKGDDIDADGGKQSVPGIKQPRYDDAVDGDAQGAGSGKNGEAVNGFGPAYDKSYEDATMADPDAEPELDMAEFLRKQAERQRQYEDKTQRKLELERRREELDQRHKELAARQREEKMRLMAKLAEAGRHADGNADSVATTGGAGSYGDIEVKMSSSSPGNGNQRDMLRAKLAALEEEALSLGLDPHAAGSEDHHFGGPGADGPGFYGRGGRGAGSFRGRGSYRGRGGGGWPGGAMAPPFRGRGGPGGGYSGRGSIHAAFAAYSLDNRPKSVVVTGVDFTVPQADEALKQHLFGIGEFPDIDISPTSTRITFVDRKTAEKFFYGSRALPGVEGKLEVAWAAHGAPTHTAAKSTTSATAPAAAPSTHGNTSAATSLKNGHEGNGSNGEAAATGERQEQQAAEQSEMDYDVADDNDWGIS